MTDVSRELDDLSIVERTSLEERLLERHALPAAAAIPRRPRSDPTPLSFAQQRLWFLEQLQPGTPLHNMSRVIRLKGVLDRAVLQQSLDAIVARHEVLRTRIVATNGIPEQIVSPPAPVTVAVTDLRGLAPGAREPEAQRLVADEAREAVRPRPWAPLPARCSSPSLPMSTCWCSACITSSVMVGLASSFRRAHRVLQRLLQ